MINTSRLCKPLKDSMQKNGCPLTMPFECWIPHEHKDCKIMCRNLSASCNFAGVGCLLWHDSPQLLLKVNLSQMVVQLWSVNRQSWTELTFDRTVVRTLQVKENCHTIVFSKMLIPPKVNIAGAAELRLLRNLAS
jgi:hypothetical protein